MAEETEKLLEDTKRDLQKRNIKPEDIEKRSAELKESLGKEAIRRVRLFFLLDEIANLENIKAATKDMDDTFKVLAEQWGKSKEEVKDYYVKNKLLNQLRSQIRESRVVEFLINNADVKDIK